MNMHHCPHCGCQLMTFEPFTNGNVCIADRGLIIFGGQSIGLPPTLHILTEALIRARGRGLPRSVLANLLGSEINDSSVTKYIERVRETFRAIDPDFDQIECIRGFGAYKWVSVHSVCKDQLRDEYSEPNRGSQAA